MRIYRMHRHAVSNRARGLAALLVVAFVGSNLGSYLHEATERHARCPEHGEVIHVAAEPANSAAPISPAAEDTTGVVIRTPARDAAGHDHEHCYLCPTTRERAVMKSARAFGLADASAALQPATHDHAALASRDLYTLAPKTSPPA